MVTLVRLSLLLLSHYGRANSFILSLSLYCMFELMPHAEQTKHP